MIVSNRSTAGSDPRPRSITLFPAYRSNPFLTLMAVAPLADGVDVRGVMTFARLLDALRAAAQADVVHVHWTTPIVQHARTAAEAIARVSELEREITAMQRRGGHVLWTVHNRLPHEIRHESEERALMQMLAARADLVHTMSPNTATLIRDIVEIDSEKILPLAHPSYAGVYPDVVDRDEARNSFALTDDDFAVMFVGQMRPYKGLIDLLLAAQYVAATGDGRRLVLMLAGEAQQDAIAQIEQLLPPGRRSIVTFGPLPDHELSRWHRASDLVVLPYRQVLNSGSLHLAATFETPVVLPGIPHLRAEFGSEEWVTFFDEDDAVASLRALLQGPPPRPSAESFWPFLDERSPWRFSRAYADALTRLDKGLSRGRDG